jgi:two-component system sensor histidine kinase VicK
MAQLQPKNKSKIPFLSEGGEMGQLIRDFDWSLTPLGPPEEWPAALKIAVGTMMRSPFPMHITWGPEYIQLYNDGYRPTLGDFKHPRALGCPIWKSFPEIWDTIGPMFHGVMEGKAVRFSDLKLYLNRNGFSEECYFDFAYSPIIDEEGLIGGVLTNVLETTEKRLHEIHNAQLTERLNAINQDLAAFNEELRLANKELEIAQHTLKDTFAQLEESETALRLAIEAAEFGTWHINSSTRAFITSARLKELFGYYAHEDLTIEDALARITDDYRDFVSTSLENAIYNRGEYDLTYPVIGFHDNKLRWLRAIGNLKQNLEGGFSEFTGVVMDVSEYKIAEQRKDDFFAMVSHELKTPLTSVNAYLQILQKKYQNVEDRFTENALSMSVKQVQKMTKMINGFLNVSRLESGKLSVEFKAFDIAELIKEVEQETLAIAQSHSMIFDPIESIIVQADREKIGQVISNLISNAIKYSPAGSDITISCIAKSEYLYISVADFGPGIKEEQLEKIFDRYYRVENEYTANISGFGIGLYLCSELVKLHGGRIWAESQIGGGSIFNFTLPISSVN